MRSAPMNRWCCLAGAGLLAGVVALGSTACGSETTPPVPDETAIETTAPPGPASRFSAAPDVAVVPLPITGDIARDDAEVSGLAWLGDTLVLLPQFPGWLEEKGRADGALYGINRAAIDAYLDGQFEGPLEAHRLAFDAGGLDESIDGFEGFEAIAFAAGPEGPPIAYLAVEAHEPEMRAYVVQASVAPGDEGPAITVDPSTLVAIDLPTQIDNMAVESLVPTTAGVVAFFEANGRGVNPSPVAWPLRAPTPLERAQGADLPDLALAEPVAFPPIEYRVTDATAMDARGRLWVLNTFRPGEAELVQPDDDPLADAYGESPSHTESDVVERLVPLVATDEGFDLVRDQPPIQLKLAQKPRHWEGLVRMGADRGFLVVTDESPETILGFVPGL